MTELNNNSEVTDVLNFWFGGNIDTNYKTKWFPSGNEELRITIDNEITARYSALLDRAVNGELDMWMNSIYSCVALIVILDQFSRHIYRSLPPDANQRKVADSKALHVAEKLVSMPGWDNSLTTSMFVFALMPFRHSATVDRLQNVMAAIDQREIKDNAGLNVLQKFKKQTVRRLQHLQDRLVATLSDDILEHHPFQADISDIMSNPLVLATQEFLKRRKSEVTNDGQPFDTYLSLSGGVDSMVILFILHTLRTHIGIQSIVCVHIDYANREESKHEADFVESYSKQLGCIFHKRTINEVTRGVTDRSAYEKISRDIRYNFYKEILGSHSSHSSADSSSGAGIIFGHHKGDVQENVLSNIMRGCNPLLLSGMHEVGVSEGVTVWRPLLSFPKSLIFAFAHKYGVPYLKDTTPSWSTRGKLRRQLIPLLIDMYGEGCLQHLSDLATESEDARKLVHENIYEPFLQNVKYYPGGLLINILPYLQQPLCFWKELLKQVMHSMSMAMIGSKAILNFYERIHRPDMANISGWLELKKGYGTYIDMEGNLIIFRDGAVIMKENTRSSNSGKHNQKKNKTSRKHPKEDENSIAVIATDLIVSESKDDDIKDLTDSLESHAIQDNIVCYSLTDFPNIRVGKWNINIELLYKNSTDDDIKLNQIYKEQLKKHAITDMISLLQGKFDYYLFFKHSKGSLRLFQTDRKPPENIPALNGIDSKVRLGIPFLIPHYEADTHLKSDIDSSLIVHLTYTFC